MEQHYTASDLLAETPPNLATYQGPIRLVVTISRFDNADNAQAAYDTATADLASTLARNGNAKDMRMLAAIFDDGPAMYKRYLFVQSGDLLFEILGLAIGEDGRGHHSDAEAPNEG